MALLLAHTSQAVAAVAAGTFCLEEEAARRAITLLAPTAATATVRRARVGSFKLLQLTVCLFRVVLNVAIHVKRICLPSNCFYVSHALQLSILLHSRRAITDDLSQILCLFAFLFYTFIVITVSDCDTL